MVLTDPNHPRAPRVHYAIGIAQSSRPSGVRGDGSGRPSQILAIEALVHVVAEINDAVAGQIRAAAIFMDAGPHIEGRFAGARHRRGDVERAAAAGAADDY